MTAFDPRFLRDAFGTFMTGVTVVTAYGNDDLPLGFTANSFSSVSLNPPLLLVCLANSSSNFTALTNAKGFAINVLSETQKEVSNTFASPVEDRFSVCEWKNGPNGCPVFEGVSAWFDCSMHKVIEAGDHVILIGKVEAFGTSTTPGLGYARGAYFTSGLERSALSGHATIVISALIARDRQILLEDDGTGSFSLPSTIIGIRGTTVALKELIKNSGVTAAPGFVYSVFEDNTKKQQHISFLCQAAEGTPARGEFYPLNSSTLRNVSNPAVRTMLERFTNESRMDNYGVYFGDQISGEVHSATTAGKV